MVFVPQPALQPVVAAQFQAQREERLALFHSGFVEDHIMDVFAGTLGDQTKGDCGVQQELMLKGITSVVVATIDFVLPIALEKLEPGPPMSPKETHPARSRVRYTWTMNDKTC